MRRKLPKCLNNRKRKLDSGDKKSEFVIQGHQQPQQAQGSKKASHGFITQPLNIFIHAHRCRRQDLDVMNSGGIVQPVSRMYLKIR